jgi:hypothetical protein
MWKPPGKCSLNNINWDIDGSSSGSFEMVRFGLIDAEGSCYGNFIHIPDMEY